MMTAFAYVGIFVSICGMYGMGFIAGTGSNNRDLEAQLREMEAQRDDAREALKQRDSRDLCLIRTSVGDHHMLVLANHPNPADMAALVNEHMRAAP